MKNKRTDDYCYKRENGFLIALVIVLAIGWVAA